MSEATQGHPFFFKRVERLMADSEYASSTLSQTVRTVSVGLAALIYPVVVSGAAQNAIAKQYASSLAVASFFGLVAVMLDAIQYFAVEVYTRSELARLSELYKFDQADDPAQFMGDPKSTKRTLIKAVFIAKVVVAALGCAIVVGVVASGILFAGT